MFGKSARCRLWYPTVAGLALAACALAQGSNTPPVPLTIGATAHAALHGPGGIPYRTLPVWGSDRETPGSNRRSKMIAPTKYNSSILPPPIWYPGDIANPDHGAVVVAAQHHP